MWSKMEDVAVAVTEITRGEELGQANCKRPGGSAAIKRYLILYKKKYRTYRYVRTCLCVLYLNRFTRSQLSTFPLSRRAVRPSE